jgi:tRNA (adenine22-N1)-methyltransferase
MVKEVKLDARLMACAGFVRKGKSIVDIGSDHALLPCYLWQNGWTDIIAADVNEKPLKSAQRTLDLYEADVKLILSDGFENIPPCDDVIIAGMGGELIAEILAGCKFKTENTRFILQPMTRHEVLRRELYRMGYVIISEKYTQSKNKSYTVIHAEYTGVGREISDVSAFIGKQTEPAYKAEQLEKVRKLAKGNPQYNILINNLEEEILL